MIESCITFLSVSDLKRTVQFYTEVIGLTLWKDMGNCVIFDCGKGYWGFCQYEDGRPLATGTCMSLNCTDCAEVDEQYQQVRPHWVSQHRESQPAMGLALSVSKGIRLDTIE